MNLCEILKNVPKGTKLYSPAFGEVEFRNIYNGKVLTIDSADIERLFYSTGNFYKDGECMLFPSRENRDWNTFIKISINTLKPFDKVLVRNSKDDIWCCDLFSHIEDSCNMKFKCIGTYWNQCIPYNDETEHLVGKTSDCPKYYKTW